MRTMLILRGNSGTYEDEDGNAHKYAKGALHEGPAIELAARRGFKGQVLDVSGDPKWPGGTRNDSPQTLLALRTFRSDSSVKGLYGFSGGGYNVWWILTGMTPAERERLKLVVVVGVDTDKPATAYNATKFTGGSWDLIYRPNHPAQHMREPAALLQDTPAGRYRDRQLVEEDD